VTAAALTATGMIAYQVAAKATRDAFFLSTFSVSGLPAMMVASALLAILLAIAATRAFSAWGPEWVLPRAFAASAALILVEWGISYPFRGLAAILVYLHYGAFGALLISGFWSIVGERFDPRTAKRHLGRISAGGTIGGLLGGAVAAQVANALPVTAMLPILAALHALTAALAARLGPGQGPDRGAARAESNGIASVATPPPVRRERTRELLRAPYIKGLIALVLLVTIGEGLVDLVLKGRAAAALGNGGDLLRFFAAFYTGISILTIVVQALASRVALERLGPARAAALLPAGAAAAAVAALAIPSLLSAAVARGVQSVLGNSLYQTGYEVLFTPVPAREKRRVKSLADVGGAKLGDILAAGLAQAVHLLAFPSPGAVLLAIAATVSIAALIVAIGLHAGYVRALERGLVSRAVQLDLSEVFDSTTRSTVLRTLGSMTVPRFAAAELNRDAGSAEGPQAPVPIAAADSDAARTADLHSRDSRRVIRALRGGTVTAAVAPQAVSLLAWDEVAREAIEALRRAGPVVIESLVTRLLDPETEYTIRRRIPHVLATRRDPRAAEALLAGLADRRFEVRFRCGRALSHLRDLDPGARVTAERVYEAVLREADAGEGVWKGRQILDDMDDAAWSPVLDEAIRSRANRSLEHVFTLLTLVMPRQPLRIAFRGLHTDDPLLRGTALEYLESALPPEIRKRLWPFLEDDRPRRPAASRPAEEALANLLESSDSIVLNLEQLERGRNPSGEEPGA